MSAAPAAAATAPAGRSLWADAALRLRRNRAAVASLVVITVLALAAILGPYVTPHAYDRVYPLYVRTAPSLEARPVLAEAADLARRVAQRARADVTSVEPAGDRLTIVLTSSRGPVDPRVAGAFDRSDVFTDTRIVGTAEEGRRLTLDTRLQRNRFLLGTDANGRDLLTRTLIALRVSLSIGLLASLVAFVIGVAWGATAGYLGGRVDAVMMRIVDILYALPFIFFVIMLVVFFGRNFVLMFLAVGAVEWLDMARIVRGQTLSLKRQEFVQAAEALGVAPADIIRRHIVPNTLGTVVVFLTLLVPRVILIESFLSFLGLGVQEPLTSLGVLISDGAKSIQDTAFLLVVPSVVLVALLAALNFLGDGLRDALDPKDR